MKSPCMSCQNRREKCHATCELYKHFKSRVEKARAEQQKESALYKDMTQHIRYGSNQHASACTIYDYSL